MARIRKNVSAPRPPEPPEEEEPPPIQLIDLRGICRDSDKILTTIILYDEYERHEWMKLGQIQIRERDSHHHAGQWRLDAYMADATDFEEDSAYAMMMELIGVSFKSIHYGQTRLVGWINTANLRGFRVPPDSSYNPMKMEGASICEVKGCGPHPVVPEGYYVPPFDEKLFKRVAGRKVEIITGLIYPPDPPEDDE